MSIHRRENFKSVLGETRNFSRKFGLVTAPALYKTLAVITCSLSVKVPCIGIPVEKHRVDYVLPLRAVLWYEVFAGLDGPLSRDWRYCCDTPLEQAALQRAA